MVEGIFVYIYIHSYNILYIVLTSGKKKSFWRRGGFYFAVAVRHDQLHVEETLSSLLSGGQCVSSIHDFTVTESKPILETETKPDWKQELEIKNQVSILCCYTVTNQVLRYLTLLD